MISNGKISSENEYEYQHGRWLHEKHNKNKMNNNKNANVADCYKTLFFSLE